MSSGMQITVSQEQITLSITILHISGELGIDNYEELQERAYTLIKDGARRIILDMSQITYLGSAGLRAIHAIFNMLQEEDDGNRQATARPEAPSRATLLKVVSPPPDVLRVLETMGFDMFLETYDSLKAALAAF